MKMVDLFYLINPQNFKDRNLLLFQQTDFFNAIGHEQDDWKEYNIKNYRLAVILSSLDGSPYKTRPIYYTSERFARRKVCAFNATITVLRDMNRAPIAGDSKNPNGARIPAANGSATIL